MLDQLLVYIGAFLPFMWGVSHLFPTKNVVNGFGDISTDNRRIITMEWIIEGVALIFLGITIAAVTYVDIHSPVSRVVYWISFAMLNTLSLVSLMTGAKIKFLPFRLCPVIFTSSSLLIIIGASII
jgi:hypothetical protein